VQIRKTFNGKETGIVRRNQERTKRMEFLQPKNSRENSLSVKKDETRRQMTTFWFRRKMTN